MKLKLEQILKSNGFEKNEYETISNKTEIEYIPSDDVVEIIINEGIRFRTSNSDSRIRIESDKLTILTSYQDYFGGFYNNEFNIDFDIIKKIKIKRTNF